MINLINQMANCYTKLKPAHITGTFNLCIGQENYRIIMTEDAVRAEPGMDAAPFITFIMSEETFAKLNDGTWTGLTAAGRENIRQSAPVDFRLPPGQGLTTQLMQTIYHIGMHFFSCEIPHTYRFGPEHTRTVHGGDAVALAYGPGVRFAYYTIAGDQQINDNATRDPMDQFISVIGGEGIAVIDGREVSLCRGIAVHVPPMATHVFRATPGSRLELFWLAYGKGA